MALLIATVLAASASADHGEPLAQNPETGDQTGLDTDATPIAKSKGSPFLTVAGAKFGADQADGSLTPYDVDFFALDFFGEASGFAGGARCRRAESGTEVTGPDAESCERIPVIWRYTAPEGDVARWDQVYLGDNETDRGGYVGAISWLGEDRALAVGGTGGYPRRELARDPGESDADYYARNEAGEAQNAAGMARAWLFERGSWRELNNRPDPPDGFTGADGDEIPDELRGMSAVDASPRPVDDCDAERECAIVGALGQLWRFTDGRFEPGGITAALGPGPSAELEDALPEGAEAPTPSESEQPIRFRVREIRFVDGDHAPEEASVLAATAGCCGRVPADEGASLLRFDGDSWRIASGRQQGYFSFWPSRPEERTAPDRSSSGGPGDVLAASAIVSPSAPPQGTEPPTKITGPTGVEEAPSGPRPCPGGAGPSGANSLSGPACAPGELGDGSVCSGIACTTRLVSADADLLSPCVKSSLVNKFVCGEPGPPDGVADWSVGVQRSSGRGVAYTTATTTSRLAGGLLLPTPGFTHGAASETCTEEDAVVVAVPNATLGGNVFFQNWGICQPDVIRDKARSGALIGLSTYALNAFQMPANGWAVGDHGAIARLGDGPPIAGVPPSFPPPLQDHDATPLPDPLLGDEPLTVTDEPGVVPALASRSLKVLDKPIFSPGGSPDTVLGTRKAEEVAAIAMSRDGSQGWAVGPGGFKPFAEEPRLALYGYDGSRWTRCTIEPIEAIGVEEDPACSGLAGLRQRNLLLYDIARIPLERDDDPTNDDEFEAVAVGRFAEAGGNQAAAVLRYRDGRWDLSQQWTQELTDSGDYLFQVVFTAPDDGWVTTGGFTGPTRLAHFDGERWVDCRSLASLCDDPEARLPLSPGSIESDDPGLRLASSGQRMYIIATRKIGDARGSGGERYPSILYHDRGGTWRGGVDTSGDGTYNPTDGGWDPGCVRIESGPTGSPGCAGTGAETDQGRVFAVSAGQGSGGGELEGWALGQFGGLGAEAEDTMLRLEDGVWRRWRSDGAVADYVADIEGKDVDPRRLVTAAGAGGDHSSFLFAPDRPPLAFNRRHQRWEALVTPFWRRQSHIPLSYAGAHSRALALDGQGGFWLAVREPGPCSKGLDLCGNELWFYNYTRGIPEPALVESPNPARTARITALTGGPDGSAWMGDENGEIYRYDRSLGWSRGDLPPGWDPPRATNRHGVTDIAVGPDGRGFAVGEGGRVAELAPSAVRLDQASDRSCRALPVAPCGTGSDLRAVAVAPDGSSLAVGEGLALLWRPAGGTFRAATLPGISATAALLDVVMPAPDRAWMISDRGHIFAGTLDGARWRWRLEATVEAAGFESFTSTDRSLSRPLNAIAVDAGGTGYAAGNDGILLEREAEGRWVGLDSGFLDNLRTIMLPPGGGEGALIGGEKGLVMTLAGGRFQVAQHGDPYSPVNGSDEFARVNHVALVPGLRPGQVEAWAVAQGPRIFGRRDPVPQVLLHYASDQAEPLLDPTARLEPLEDAPGERQGELALAAFGNQACQAYSFGTADRCFEMEGVNFAHEIVASRVNEEVSARAPDLALFSGDAADAAGRDAGSFTDPLRTTADRNLKYRRWVELVADPLADAGVPLFAAIGGGDLSHSQICIGSLIGCLDSSGRSSLGSAGSRTGTNGQWRQASAAMPAPWEREQRGELGFERLPDSPGAQRPPESEIPAGTTPEVNPPVGNAQPGRELSPGFRTGGADTHYAVDVSRDGEKIARIVAVDTSLRSLAGADPIQSPIEPDGQAGWLERVTCIDGSAADTDQGLGDCTREPGQRTIVISNTPTYSYGPIPPNETQVDAAAFEAILIKNEVDLVVSGGVGWAGRYWATAPGVHEPCPGQDYRPDWQAPEPGTRFCGEGPEGEAPDPGELLEQGGAGLLPVVVAATGGGKFNERAEDGGLTDAASGFWRGYAIVRLHPSGDPRKTVVEQRPVLDSVQIEGAERILHPKQRLSLRGFGQEPFGLDTPIRFIEIDSPAITHRYALLAADPKKPWLPLRNEDADADPEYAGYADQATHPSPAYLKEKDPCGPYVCLDPEVGTLDHQSGELVAGDGNYPRTRAIATLTVGSLTATYPLAFEPRPSFRVGVAPADQPPGAALAPPPPPAPAQAPAGTAPPEVTFPPIPTPPAVPLLAATPTAPPPGPPAPPAPPASEAGTPIDLFSGIEGISVSPQTTVPPPPPPPVNPAPPGGARREARQRQAAVQKGEAESGDEGGSEARNLGGDAADGPPIPQGTEMTRREGAGGASHPSLRRDRVKSAPSFSAIDRASAWERGALYGGGITLMALVAAIGFATLRPKPGRRPPELPAPAWARDRSSR